MNWRAEVPERLCTGSFSSRWANGRPTIPPDVTNQEALHWQHETGECWDCGDRFPLVERRGRQVLAKHVPNEEER